MFKAEKTPRGRTLLEQNHCQALRILGCQAMRTGKFNRTVAETSMNEHSSRSHLLFLLTVEQSDSATGTVKVPRPLRRQLHNVRYVIHIKTHLP